MIRTLSLLYKLQAVVDPKMMSGLALAKKPTLTDDQKMGSCLNVTVSLEGVTSLAKMPHCLSAGELMLNDCRAELVGKYRMQRVGFQAEYARTCAGSWQLLWPQISD